MRFISVFNYFLIILNKTQSNDLQFFPQLFFVYNQTSIREKNPVGIIRKWFLEQGR